MSTMAAVSSLGGEYNVKKPLNVGGLGAFGFVHLGERKRDGSPVVIKEVKLSTPRRSKLIRREVEVMRDLSHSHMVSFLNSYEVDDRLFIVMNYAEKGDLFNAIDNTKHHRLPEAQCKKWFAQMVRGIDYMHSTGYLHLDLKPDNVFIDANGDVMIGDFGRSRPYNGSVATVVASPGTMQYSPPEAIYRTACEMFDDADLVYKQLDIPVTRSGVLVKGPEMDVFALGATLFVMASGIFPFGGTGAGLVKNILLDEPHYPFHMSAELVSLLQRMMRKNPNERISLQQVMKHPWIRDEVASQQRMQQRTTKPAKFDPSLRLELGGAFSSVLTCSPRAPFQVQPLTPVDPSAGARSSLVATRTISSPRVEPSLNLRISHIRNRSGGNPLSPSRLGPSPLSSTRRSPAPSCQATPRESPSVVPMDVAAVETPSQEMKDTSSSSHGILSKFKGWVHKISHAK